MLFLLTGAYVITLAILLAIGPLATVDLALTPREHAITMLLAH